MKADLVIVVVFIAVCGLTLMGDTTVYSAGPAGGYTAGPLHGGSIVPKSECGKMPVLSQPEPQMLRSRPNLKPGEERYYPEPGWNDGASERQRQYEKDPLKDCNGKNC